MITEFLDKIDSVMYYPILIIVMSLAGLYFTALPGEYRSDCFLNH